MIKKQTVYDLPLILEFEFLGTDLVKGTSKKGKAYEFLKAIVVTTTFSNEDGKPVPTVTHTPIDSEVQVPQGRHKVLCMIEAYNDSTSRIAIAKLIVKKIVSTQK
jgi:hypothetical protein